MTYPKPESIRRQFIAVRWNSLRLHLHVDQGGGGAGISYNCTHNQAWNGVNTLVLAMAAVGIENKLNCNVILPGLKWNKASMTVFWTDLSQSKGVTNSRLEKCLVKPYQALSTKQPLNRFIIRRRNQCFMFTPINKFVGMINRGAHNKMLSLALPGEC